MPGGKARRHSLIGLMKLLPSHPAYPMLDALQRLLCVACNPAMACTIEDLRAAEELETDKPRILALMDDLFQRIEAELD